MAVEEHDMRRRDFLTTTAGMTVLGACSAAGVRARESAASTDPDPLVRALVRANDEQVARLLPRQERRASHPRVGGLPNEHGIYAAGEAAGFVSALACASCAPGSSFFHSTALVEPLQLAVRFLLEVQHDDGTIDLHTTNFHSPPDTAFVLEALCPACTVMQREAWPPHAAVVADLRRFAVRAGAALVSGGVHTPNHRWVVCAALARLNALSPDPDYVARIDQWLAETVDIDPDGQFTERSTAVYSAVVDRALLTVARLLDRPALREPVRRNLEMTVFYVHPDGEVVTEASRRQDRYQRGSLARYYYSYRTLALLDGNGRFAAMARQIEQAERPHLTSEWPAFLEEPGLQQPLPAVAPLPADYVRVFSYSGLARIRRGPVSATILADNSSLFSLRKGTAALEAVRLASAFFGKGQFAGDRLEVRGGRFILRQVLDGPYYQPFSPEQIAAGVAVRRAPNGTLAPDSRAARGRSNVQTLESVVEITEADGAFELDVAVGGTDGVPVAVELAFRHGGRLHGVEAVPDLKDAYLLREGTGRYTSGADTITFGAGRAEHSWTQLRGALPKWDGQSVYLTGFTPFHLRLAIG
jgi:hypothetical protein